MDINTSLIESIIYRSTIDSLCTPLKLIGDIKNFVLYIIFNDGQKFVLSNNPSEFISFYWNENLFKYDGSTKEDLFDEKNYYLCNITSGIGNILKETLELKFNLYRTFYMMRQCPECKFIFGALHNYQVIDPFNLYNSIIDRFEDFCIDFIDKTIDLIKLHNPNYNRSIILNDKFYRRSIIKMNNTLEQGLTDREVQCLYWAANGKSSSETALILKIQTSTVEDYRKKIKRKLNCSSMSHAVYEGIKQGYIGAFHRLTSDFFDASKQKA